MTARIPIAERLAAVHDALAEACRLAGRAPQAVRVVAVSKRVDARAVIEAAAAGQRDFGENYVLDGLRKIAAVGREDLHWHMIGHLQSNKAAKAARGFDMIQSLTTFGAARAVSRGALEIGRPCHVLIQVHLGGSDRRSGLAAAEVLEFARRITELPAIVVDGVMGVAPLGEPPQPHFARLREILESLRGLGLANAPLGELSAGMSDDYREAVAEGATIVRVGRAIFGN